MCIGHRGREPTILLFLWLRVCHCSNLPRNLQPFEQQAAAEKEAVRQAALLAPAITAADDADDDGEGGGASSSATILPISKVKRIAKLDEECGNIGKDAAYVLTVATEMFVELLAEAAAGVAMVRAGMQ